MSTSCSIPKSDKVDIHGKETSVEIVEQELSSNPDRKEEKNGTDQDTPLLAAVKNGNAPLIQFLLSIRANIETKDKASLWFKKIKTFGIIGLFCCADWSEHIDGGHWQGRQEIGLTAAVVWSKLELLQC